MVMDSLIQGAGQGLFARKDFAPGQLVAFYNGIKVDRASSDKNSKYKIDNSWSMDNQVMDIPPPWRKLEAYTASLAHKINHQFKK